ncbi:MAG: DUF502 domain-containing protein [Phycisphaerae bacterium]
MVSREFKHFFMRGLGVLVPTIATIAILAWAYRFVDQNVGSHITRGLVAVYAWQGKTPGWMKIGDEAALQFGDPIDEWHEQTGRRLTAQYKAMHAKALDGPSSDMTEEQRELAVEARERALTTSYAAMWELATRKWKFFSVIGFVIAILLIYFTGYFLASFIGRWSWQMVERTIRRTPLISAIYPAIKQVTDFFISDEKKTGFSGVVAVQYPRKGIWSVGLVTGAPIRAISQDDPRELITVFVPSSPTPVTGYTITVARADVLELPLTIDDALRYAISAGVVQPDHRMSPAQPLASR